jgi:hypothetical protein
MRLSLALGASLLATSAFADDSKNLNKLDLTVHPNAMCLDGSPGAYYFLPSPNPSSTAWQIFFEGGGWCYNEKDCANRAKTDLGSSNSYPDYRGGDGGVADRDCEVNPTFCETNYVYIKYCDGTSFAGGRDDAVNVDGNDLHFKGHYILEGILDDLFAKYDMQQATELLLTGCSAGGLSTHLQSDRVREYVQDKQQSLGAQPLAKYAAVPVSGYFAMDQNNYNEVPVMPDQMRYLFAMSNATVGSHQGCLDSAAPGSEWKCMTAPGAYPYIQSNFFTLDSSIDSWASNCIIGASYVDTSGPTETVPNGSCGTAEGIEDCSSGGPGSGSCSFEQMFSVIEHQGMTIRKLSNTDTYKKGTNGLFLYNCFTHCAGGDSNFYKQYTIDGVTMREAVDAFWNELDAPSPNVKSHIAEPYNTDATNPNPSC